MSIFKHDREIKRMIFNIYADLAERLEQLKDESKRFDKRLDIDTAVNKALEKFVKKAEKKIEEMRRETKEKRHKITCAHVPDSPGANTPDEFTDPNAENNPDSAV